MITILGYRGFVGRQLSDYAKLQGCVVHHFTLEELEKSQTTSLGVVYYSIGMTANFRSNLSRTIDAHILKLQRALELTKGRRDKFILISSTRLYINSQSTSPITNISASPFDLNDIYTTTKLLGESITLMENDTHVLRISNVLGPNPSQSLFSIILEQAKRGQVELHQSVYSEKDYILISDVVCALFNCRLLDVHQGNRILNIAMGQNSTISNILEELELIYNFTFHSISDVIYRCTPIDISVTQKEFDFSPSKIKSNLSSLLIRSFNIELKP